MRNLLAVTTIAAMIASPTLAQNLPSPAAEGQGQSTQTLSLAKDAIVVTLDAEGSFGTRTHERDGGVSVDVNGMSVGIGSVPTNFSSPRTQSGGDGAANTESGKMVSDLANPRANEPTVEGHVLRAQATGHMCNDDVGESISPGAIERLQRGTRVMLQLACEPVVLDAARRQAVANNAALSASSRQAISEWTTSFRSPSCEM